MSFNDERNLSEFIQVIQTTVFSYLNKESQMSDEEWAKQELSKETNLNVDDISLFANQIVNTISSNEQNKKSLEKSLSEGVTSDAWFQNKIKEATVGLSLNEVGQYLQQVDRAFIEANEQMRDVILTKDGLINGNNNLDGFIFEQYQANTFNLDASIKSKNYKAYMLKPKPGETYKKNSVDIIIKDENGHIVRKFQAKFSKDHQSANRAFKHGNYKFQRKLVAKNQSSRVKNSVDKMQYKNVESRALSKSEGKKLQRQVQDGHDIRLDWNYYEVKHLTTQMSKQVAMASVQTMAVTAGFDLVLKKFENQKIHANDVIEVALKSGLDAGLKNSISVGMKIASERGIIKIFPPGTPPQIFANVATVAIENIKVIDKVASGELTVTEGIKSMERITLATTMGLISADLGAIKGGMIGGLALSWIPFVGMPLGAMIGGVIGGTLSYMVGSKFGETICKGAQKLRSTAVGIVKAGGRAVKRGYNKAKSFVKSIFS